MPSEFVADGLAFATLPWVALCGSTAGIASIAAGALHGADVSGIGLDVMEYYCRSVAAFVSFVVGINCVMRAVWKDVNVARLPSSIYTAFGILYGVLAYEATRPTPPMWWLSMGFATGAAFPFVDRLIRTRVYETAGTSGTERVAKWVVYQGQTVEEIVEGSRNTRPGKLAAHLLNDPGPKRLSPLKALLTFLLLGLSLNYGAMAAADTAARAAANSSRRRTLHTGPASSIPSPSTTSAAAPPPAHTTSSEPAPKPTVSPTTPTSAAAAAAAAERDWMDVCPALPGSDAPHWAAPIFFLLYLGGKTSLHLGPAPGALAGGCTGSTTVVGHGRDSLAYEIGTDPVNHGMDSIAVVSKRFAPTIYYWPAAEAVLGLIHAGEVVGGSPRLNIENGDAYFVESQDGLWAFVRDMKTGSDGSAARYVELSPAIVRAWRDAMVATDDNWLWPIERRDDGQTETVRLVANPITRDVVETIVFDKTTGEVYIKTPTAGLVGVSSAPVDPSWLAAVAATAGQ